MNVANKTKIREEPGNFFFLFFINHYENIYHITVNSHDIKTDTRGCTDIGISLEASK